jgi:hypothetical protein
MFKGFQSTRQFRSFPSANYQMNNQAYGFSGCTFWLDAEYGTNTQTNGANVSLWTDKISGISFTQSTVGSQPTYVTSLASFNNNPAIFFSAKTMSYPNLIGNFYTVVFVVQNVTNGVINQFLGDSSTNNVWFNGGTAAGYDGFGIRRNGSVQVASSYGEDLNAHIAVFNPSYIVVDGAVRSTATSTLSGFSNFHSTHQYYISNFICYNVNYTSSQAIEICNNINTKYAIY